MSTVAAEPRRSGNSAPIYPKWILPELDAPELAAFAAIAGVPAAIAALLFARGLRTAADARRFLAPEMAHLHDPYAMRGMSTAVERIQVAIRNDESIFLYGDYDVDGTTAIVLLKTAIERLGGRVRYHIPHRLRDGYGMQAEVLAQAAFEGARLVISVDTGIRAFAASEEARQQGLDLIITDHHLPDAARSLPHALAVLNPNQHGCEYPSKHLCGAGVAFKLAQALLEAHDPVRAREKLLPSFLKMLAIATVADAVPLLGENRAIVSLGLRALRRLASPGLRSLMAVAELQPQAGRLTATEIAFRLAPRINAAGRMDVASDVVELFTTRDDARAQLLAEKLDRLNNERRAAEADVLQQIDARLDAELGASGARCLVIDGEPWHRGILGIVASRIVERAHRPALVIAHENGEAHGSGRSIPGFHLLDALETCADLFTRFGGHAQAVGFALPSDRVVALRERLSAHATTAVTDTMLTQTLRCDALLPLHQITPAFYQLVERMEPFGMGNPEPVFIAMGATLTAPPLVMKERHTRLRLAQPPGSVSFSALGWRKAEHVAALGLKEGSRIDLAYRLRENTHPEFGGLELEIVDLRRSE